MAKNKEKEATIEGEQPEPQAEKPKKQSSGGISVPVLLGIILGSLVIIIVAVRFLFLPYIVQNLGESKHEEAPKPVVNKNWEQDFFKQNEKIGQYFEMGRITTNPRNSTQFVVVNIGVVYFPKSEDHLKELKVEKAKEAKEAGPEGGGGNPTLLSTKSYAQLKANVTRVLGSLSVEELQARRDSLPSMIKMNIKPVFRENELFIKDVILLEFILQE